jgi:hypothetical protein
LLNRRVREVAFEPELSEDLRIDLVHVRKQVYVLWRPEQAGCSIRLP